uniref:Uncharacterized protein n=2 Tax=Noctiluca scintillans TaxID=2966 RepID=A0A7S0ZUF7_NOCSC
MPRPQSVSPGPSRGHASRMESSSPSRFTPYPRSGSTSPMHHGQRNVPQSQNAADDSAEAHASRDPHFSPDKQLARRSQAGIASGESKRFGENCEFVSVGCFCAVAHALQSLGLKQYTYPFDWNRSPSDGVMHCLQTNFSDFLDYGFVRDEGHKGKLFGGTAWGGSFWHHDLDDKEVRRGLLRRTERLLGYGDVPATKNRFFVRSANSSREVLQTLQLRDVLRDAYPDASVRLLLLVEGQSKKTAWRIEGDVTDLLMVNVPTMQYAPGSAWTMKVHAEAYADAIGFGLHYFANAPHALNSVNTVKDLPSYMDTLAKWDGGSCSNQTLKVEPVIGFNFVTQLSRRGAQCAE